MQTWRIGQRNASVLNRLYEFLRRRLNGKLVTYLGKNLDRGRTLEAGSGTAYAASLMKQRPNVRLSVCMDLDHEALSLAKRRDPCLSAVVGDLRCMPFADGAFDLVYNSSTVEHLDRPESAVAEMARVCKTDGRVFVGVPGVAGPLFFQPLVAKTSVGEWVGTVFTRAGLERMINATGLKPIDRLRYFLRFFIGVLAIKPRSREFRA